jgi:hypothetical protein
MRAYEPSVCTPEVRYEVLLGCDRGLLLESLAYW